MEIPVGFALGSSIAFTKLFNKLGIKLGGGISTSVNCIPSLLAVFFAISASMLYLSLSELVHFKEYASTGKFIFAHSIARMLESTPPDKDKANLLWPWVRWIREFWSSVLISDVLAFLITEGIKSIADLICKDFKSRVKISPGFTAVTSW